MKILQTTQEQLLTVLQAVAGIVERRHTLPILANVLIKKTADKISFVSSDLEMQIKTMAAFNGEDGQLALTVNARKLLDILRTLPASQQVTLTSKQDKVELVSGKSKFSLQTIAADSFPLVQETADFGYSISISQKTLKQLFSQVSFAMAVNDIRYFLNGVLFSINANWLQVVATDAHRLALAKVELPQAQAQQAIILPRKTIIELQRLLKDDDSAVQIQLASNQAKFVFSGLEFVTKLIEGKFPEFERVIPQQTVYKINLERAELALALQRVELMTSDKFRGIQLSFAPGILKISSHNAEQEEALEEIEIAYQGPAIKLGFNVTYLKDVLSNVNDERINIELIDENSSALFTLDSEPNFRYVVMPMRI